MEEILKFLEMNENVNMKYPNFWYTIPGWPGNKWAISFTLSQNLLGLKK